MLHLIFQSSLGHALVQRIGLGDAVVLMGDSVFRIRKDSIWSDVLITLLKISEVYVLAEELAVRGIEAESIHEAIKVIGYEDLVDLTEQHKVTQSWC